MYTTIVAESYRIVTEKAFLLKFKNGFIWYGSTTENSESGVKMS